MRWYGIFLFYFNNSLSMHKKPCRMKQFGGLLGNCKLFFNEGVLSEAIRGMSDAWIDKAGDGMIGCQNSNMSAS